MRQVVCTRLLLALAPLTRAAEAKLQLGDDTLYLSTNSTTGECRVTDLPDGGRKVVCDDGMNLAAATNGCLDSRAAGYCGRPKGARTDRRIVPSVRVWADTSSRA